MHVRAVTVVGLAGVVVAACAPAAPVVDTAAEVAAIEAVRAQEVAAISSGDTSLAYLTDDAVLMAPGSPQVTGKAAARSWMREFMGMMTVQSVTYDAAEVTVAGDWAIERYTATLTMAPAGGGPAVTEALKGVHVYRKGADGAWKMAVDVWNSNTPPPGM